MKKKLSYAELTDRKCSKCGKLIKANVALRKTKPVDLCFKCFKIQNQGHSRRDFSIWPMHGNEFSKSEKGKKTLGLI